MIRVDTPTLVDFVLLARDMRDDEKAQWCAMTGRATYDAELAARTLSAIPGMAWCLRDADGHPLVIAGLEEIRGGVFQTWMAGSPQAWHQHWRTITKVCRRMFASLLADGTARRIQTYALESRRAAHQWYARGLWQAYEGTHADFYADGQAAVCYALTRTQWEAARG